MLTSNYPEGMSNEDLAYFDSPDPESEPLPICPYCEEEIYELHATTQRGKFTLHSACDLDFQAEMDEPYDS